MYLPACVCVCVCVCVCGRFVGWFESNMQHSLFYDICNEEKIGKIVNRKQYQRDAYLAASDNSSEIFLMIE